MQTTKKKDAPRLAAPAALYRKGKAPKGVWEVQDSDSDYYEDEHTQEPEGDVPVDSVAVDNEGDDEDDRQNIISHIITETKKSINVTLRNVNISKEGKVVIDGREESGRTITEHAFEEETSDRETDNLKQKSNGSSEYDSDSEEEDVEPAVMLRPVFVPKRARTTTVMKDAGILDPADAMCKRELEAEERRKQSHDMVAESIKRELAEKETEEHVPDVDDTDSLDPETEFEAWRLRELGRIKRDKAEAIRREEERAEIERRRALPEEVRLKEDLERAQKSRDDKPKGTQKFLQKYWHKGAFHQDQEILKRHDYTEATESTVDVSLLPKVMQVRDFGKRSRTKHTHLVDQDTTIRTGGFGGVVHFKPEGAQGCFNCGGAHLKKDCPQLAASFSGSREGERVARSWKGSDEVIHDNGQGHARSPQQDDNYIRRHRSTSRSRSRESWRRSRKRDSRSPSRTRKREREEKRRRVD